MHFAATHELGGAAGTLAGVAGTLLFVGLATTTAHFTAALGAVGALAGIGQLAGIRLVHQVNIDRGFKYIGGEISLFAGLFAFESKYV
jgi:uncharacterized membrane protein HdeD (DUF308 family)